MSGGIVVHLMPARRQFAVLLALVLAVVGAIPGVDVAPVRAADATTALYVEGGSFGWPEPHFVGADDATWSATYDSTTGVASVVIDYAELRFAAPPGEQLTVGDYPGAVPVFARGPGQPGMDMNLACGTGTGAFVVDEIETVGNSITHFAVSFDRLCWPEDLTFYGELRFDSTVGLRAIVADPIPLELGDGLTGDTTAASTLTFTNRGTIATSISAVSLAGDQSSEFDIVGGTCVGTTVEAGATCTVDVTMTAAATGSRSAQLVVEADTYAGSHAFKVQGTGVGVGVTPTSLAFGSQELLSTGMKTVTIHNGNAPLEIGDHLIYGDANFVFRPRIGTGCVGSTLAPFADCNVVIEYTPTTLGAHTATLGLGCLGCPAAIPLSGTGATSSGVRWTGDRAASPNWTWTGRSNFGRTAKGATTYLHALGSSDRIGGKWATNKGPWVGVYYQRTSNAGKTWTPRLRLNPKNQHAAMTSLEASGAKVYAVWVSQKKWQKYSGKAPRVLYFRANTNHGAKSAWGPIRRLTPLTGRVDEPTVAANGKTVYVAYTDSGTGRVKVAISRNRGSTWKKVTLGTTTTTSTSGKIGVPSVAVRGSTVVVAWISNVDWAIKARVSTNAGRTWSPTQTLASEAWSYPSVAVGTNKVAVTWATAGGLQVRTWAGGTWATPVNVHPPAGATYGWHDTPAIALNGVGGVSVAWSGCRRQCTNQIQLVEMLWAESTDGGLTFPHVQIILTGDGSTTRILPSIEWPTANTRYLLYERDVIDSGLYRLRVVTGAGLPKPIAPAAATGSEEATPKGNADAGPSRTRDADDLTSMRLPSR
jgi:hypothetical protein